MYIAIEGLKGSGKSTLIENLSAKLQLNGFDFTVLAPTKPIPGEPHDLHLLSDEQLELRYAKRSNYHASHCVPLHSLILGDRSIYTSLATRWPATEQSKMEFIKHVRKLEHKIAIPDQVLFLNANLNIIKDRLSKRLKREYGRHDETIERLTHAQYAYDELFQRSYSFGLCKNWHFINAEQHPDSVCEDVYRIILGSQAINKLVKTTN